MMTFSTPHTRDTAAPQDYWQHAHVAITRSAKLIWFGLAGVVHGALAMAASGNRPRATTACRLRPATHSLTTPEAIF
jgi:hypothetical protein